jgi:hypothetical protein
MANQNSAFHTPIFIEDETPRPRAPWHPALDPSLPHVGSLSFLLINRCLYSPSVVCELHSWDKELSVNQELSDAELTEL